MSTSLVYFVIGSLIVLLIGIAAYFLTARKYQSSATVANSYDLWTLDGILEFYWGEHIHLGHYGSPPRRNDWTQETLPSWLDSIWQGIVRPEGLVRFGLSGFVKSVREVPTLLLMRLAFGTGLCRFGMFRAVRTNSRTELMDRNFAKETPSSSVR
ncbi:hypothetical protein CEN49_25830 [Fischerella thermalis CCMEE 5273]|nr:hypothetical protein CEN49_25830 [Fischerella thermalis CCMEE 5273]